MLCFRHARRDVYGARFKLSLKLTLTMSSTPSRFSENMSLKDARKILRDVSFSTPSLPESRGSRIFASVSLDRREGEKVYVLHIFDRASPWVMPRYARTIIRDSLRVAVADGVTWIEDRTPELRAMADKVNGAILSVQPFTAETHP